MPDTSWVQLFQAVRVTCQALLLVEMRKLAHCCDAIRRGSGLMWRGRCLPASFFFLLITCSRDANVAMIVQTICNEINIILLEKSVSVAYLIANYMLSIQ